MFSSNVERTVSFSLLTLFAQMNMSAIITAMITTKRTIATIIPILRDLMLLSVSDESSGFGGFESETGTVGEIVITLVCDDEVGLLVGADDGLLVGADDGFVGADGGFVGPLFLTSRVQNDWFK